jgi:hypothetical protein
MAGNLNAKHEEWNSRLTTRLLKLLRDYAEVKSCLIFGPDTTTTNPHKHSATPDDLDIEITKNLNFPVYLTSCSALSSDNLPVLIDTACRSSFQHPPDGSDFSRIDWANFQTHLEDQIPFDLELHNGLVIDKCVENFSGAVLKALAVSTHKCRPRDDPRPPIPTGIQDEIRLKDRLRRRWQVTRDPALKADFNRLAAVGDPSAQRVQERPMERDTRIPRFRRPIAVPNNPTGDESSYSVCPLVTRGNRSRRFSES